MVQLDNETLEKVQMVELEMLIELDRICRKNNIRYTIIGGTLIGAKRNGGFIPWDDDIDVAMLRGEYEKFRKACKTDLDHSRFYFQDHRNTRGYRWGYGKLRRKDTLFLREHQEHMPYEQGIFLDVFPHDGVPNAYLARVLHNFQCFLIRKLLWSEVGKVADKSGFKRKLYLLMSKASARKIFSSYHKLIHRSNQKQYKRVRALMFPTFGKEYGYKREWFEPGEDIEFEGLRFQCMKGAEEYLRFSYGDYMKLPPVEERKVHPVSDIKILDVVIGV